MLHQNAFRSQEPRCRLPNTGSQRIQISNVNLEAYLDDMVIKSKTYDALLRDIIEIFQNLQCINMKLNPAKCTYGVREGQFLGYIIDATRIRANPKKIQAVLDMTPPRT